MNTFEKCQSIQCMIVNKLADIISYTNKDNDLAVNKIREIPASILKLNPELCRIQPEELTEDECDRLGFGLWSKDNPMRLIPWWLLPFLADEIKTTCIDGSSVLRKADLDNDNRFGYLAYGVSPSVQQSTLRSSQGKNMSLNVTHKKSVVMQLFHEQALTISKSGSDVLIQCENGDDANAVFDWLLDI